MNLFTFVTMPKSAITYYRSSLPIETITKLYPDCRYMIDDFHPKVSDEDRTTAIHSADILTSHMLVLASARWDPTDISKSAPWYFDDKDFIKYPPSIIVDVDDVYDNIHPINPAFGTWGIKDANGELLGEGFKIWANMEDGSREVLWEEGSDISFDGKDKFSLKKNWERHAMVKLMMENAQALTTTTPYLAKHFKDLHPNIKRTHVYPNCVRADHYDKVELREHPGEVRILWQGGSSHADDLKSIMKPLLRVLAKYPETRMTVFGQEYIWFNEKMPKDQFQWIDWVPYDKHRLRLATLGHDINLCPLSDHEFNLGKSACKWYESSAITRPAATLAANVLPYQEIEDGKTGLLYNTPEEFETKLGGLIESETLRRELAGNAKDWVYENRDAMKEVPKLYEFYQQVREEHIGSFELLPAEV